MGDALPVVEPVQLAVQDQPAVLAGVPPSGDPDLRHALSMRPAGAEVNGPGALHIRRTSSVYPLKASAPQAFTRAAAPTRTRTSASRNDQPDSPSSSTRSGTESRLNRKPNCISPVFWEKSPGSAQTATVRQTGQ